MNICSRPFIILIRVISIASPPVKNEVLHLPFPGDTMSVPGISLQTPLEALRIINVTVLLIWYRMLLKFLGGILEHLCKWKVLLLMRSAGSQFWLFPSSHCQPPNPWETCSGVSPKHPEFILENCVVGLQRDGRGGKDMHPSICRA